MKLNFQIFIQNLADKLYTKNVILILQEEELKEKQINNTILLLKHLSENHIRISAVLNEYVLSIIEKLNGKPALFISFGNSSAKALSKVSLKLLSFLIFFFSCPLPFFSFIILSTNLSTFFSLLTLHPYPILFLCILNSTGCPKKSVR